jgi:hypothetical protein
LASVLDFQQQFGILASLGFGISTIIIFQELKYFCYTVDRFGISAPNFKFQQWSGILATVWDFGNHLGSWQ